MKQKVIFTLLAVLLAAVFLPVLLLYISPMENASYDLSLICEDGQPWQGEKGWTVYTNTAGTVKELTSHGTGAYSGLDYDGQTFYFSRQLTEDLDSPTLRIGAVNRTFSVFLDDELIYTDCPELDNRIGYLELPMLEFDRTDPIVVSLPLDYLGKTLTIAQSTSPLGSDAPGSDANVFPASVELYCGYAYESELIAQTARHIIPAALLFAAGLFILGVFVWNTVSGHPSARLLLLALLAFWMMCDLMLRVPFYSIYFGVLPVDLTALCFYCSATLLLGFLACQLSGRLRIGMLAVTLVQLAVVVFDAVSQYRGIIYTMLSANVTLAALLIALVLALLAWRNRDAFFRPFCLFVLGGILLAALTVCGALLLLPSETTSHLRYLLTHATALTPLNLLLPLYSASTFAIVTMQSVKALIHSRSEAAARASMEQLTRTSYESLRLQTEQTMELRHDIRNHLSVLRALLAKSDYNQAAEYLDNLVAQSKRITPVLRCGNQMLDLILNGTLATAIHHQIRVELVHTEAPASLPLPDTDLVSLVVNVMDNAVKAARAAEESQRFIQLDLRVQGNFFFFRCTNSMVPGTAAPKRSSSAVSRHGHDLKIIQRILSEAGGFYRIQTGEDRFQITLTLPLS